MSILVAGVKQYVSLTVTNKAPFCVTDDADWPPYGLSFNLARTKIPALIVYVEDVDTIREALKFAKQFNIRVSLISSGIIMLSALNYTI